MVIVYLKYYAATTKVYLTQLTISGQSFGFSNGREIYSCRDEHKKINGYFKNSQRFVPNHEVEMNNYAHTSMMDLIKKHSFTTKRNKIGHSSSTTFRPTDVPQYQIWLFIVIFLYI